MIDFNDYTRQIKKVLLKVSTKNWAPACSGNFSALSPKNYYQRFQSNQLQRISLINSCAFLSNYDMLFSCSGVGFDDIADNFIYLSLAVNTNANGTKINVLGFENNIKYSITTEYLSHLLLLNYFASKGKENIFLIHVHIPEFIAITHHLSYKNSEKLTALIWSMFPEAKNSLKTGVCFVPYQKPGSHELANETIKNYSGQEIIVWEKHGVLACAENPIEALNRLEIATEALKVFFICRNAGFYPEDIVF